MQLKTNNTKESADFLIPDKGNQNDKVKRFSISQKRNTDVSVMTEMNNANRLIYEDGTVYIGELKGKQKHGKGKLIDDKGQVYEGEFKNDKMDGFGEFKVFSSVAISCFLPIIPNR